MQIFYNILIYPIENIVMKIYLWIINCFIFGLMNLKADIFLIEDEADIERVSNTFIYFYTQNEKQLIILKDNDFDKILCRKFIHTFKKLHPENPLCHIGKIKQAKKSFIVLKQYILAHSDLIKNVIGEAKYNLFTWGVYYTYFLLKSL